MRAALMSGHLPCPRRPPNCGRKPHLRMPMLCSCWCARTQEEAALPRAPAAACSSSSSSDGGGGGGGGAGAHSAGLTLSAGMKAAAALVATCGGDMCVRKACLDSFLNGPVPAAVRSTPLANSVSRLLNGLLARASAAGTLLSMLHRIACCPLLAAARAPKACLWLLDRALWAFPPHLMPAAVRRHRLEKESRRALRALYSVASRRGAHMAASSRVNMCTSARVQRPGCCAPPASRGKVADLLQTPLLLSVHAGAAGVGAATGTAAVMEGLRRRARKGAEGARAARRAAPRSGTAAVSARNGPKASISRKWAASPQRSSGGPWVGGWVGNWVAGCARKDDGASLPACLAP